MYLDETSSDDNLICPYCGDESQVETESYNETERIETCFKCKKKFYAHEEFSVTHYGTPNCLLNGEEHSFSLYEGKTSSVHICDKCGDLKNE